MIAMRWQNRLAVALAIVGMVQLTNLGEQASAQQVNVSAPFNSVGSGFYESIGTRWGLSGPGILKISAWGARELAARGYRFDISVNWLPNVDVTAVLAEKRLSEGKRQLSGRSPFEAIPKRLWLRLLTAADLADDLTWVTGRHALERIIKTNDRLIGELDEFFALYNDQEDVEALMLYDEWRTATTVKLRAGKKGAKGTPAEAESAD